MAKKSPISKLFSMLQARISGSEQDAKQVAPSLPVLKLMFFIVDWNKVNVISDVLLEEKVRFHFISKGMGTATSEILDLLGIGGGDKAIITCLEQAVLVPVLLKEAQKKLGFYRPDAGIAFTIPLSAINDPMLLVFKQSIHKNEKITEEMLKKANRFRPKEDEGENMANEIYHDPKTHDLIVSIVNQGYSDELMNTAREAGASGGTVINARGQTHDGAVRFFGISVHDEKELILILTSPERKVNIMQAICEAHGLNSKAEGIVFSLPVDCVMGLYTE
jgi:nitrogen regulatory protein PII